MFVHDQMLMACQIKTSVVYHNSYKLSLHISTIFNKKGHNYHVIHNNIFKTLNSYMFQTFLVREYINCCCIKQLPNNILMSGICRRAGEVLSCRVNMCSKKKYYTLRWGSSWMYWRYYPSNVSMFKAQKCMYFT